MKRSSGHRALMEDTMRLHPQYLLFRPLHPSAAHLIKSTHCVLVTESKLICYLACLSKATYQASLKRPSKMYMKQVQHPVRTILPGLYY